MALSTEEQHIYFTALMNVTAADINNYIIIVEQVEKMLEIKDELTTAKYVSVDWEYVFHRILINYFLVMYWLPSTSL